MVDIAEVLEKHLIIADIILFALACMYVKVALRHSLEDTSNILDDIVRVGNNGLCCCGKYARFVLSLDNRNRTLEVTCGKFFDTFCSNPDGAADMLADYSCKNSCDDASSYKHYYC